MALLLWLRYFTVLIVRPRTSVAPFVRGFLKALLEIHTKLQDTQEEENVI